MRIVKHASILYFAGLIILWAFIYVNANTQPLDNLFFYLIPAAVLLIGLLLGWFGYMIIQYVRWIRSFYIFGMNVSFATGLLVLVAIRYQGWKDHQRYGYHSNGRSMLESADENGWRFIATGFEQLQTKFSNPGQVYLHEYMTAERDTMIGAQKDTVESVYYAYSIGSYKSALLLSKVDVCRDQAAVISFNTILATDTTYLGLKRRFHERMDPIIDSTISSLKRQQESSK